MQRRRKSQLKEESRWAGRRDKFCKKPEAVKEAKPIGGEWKPQKARPRPMAPRLVHQPQGCQGFPLRGPLTTLSSGTERLKVHSWLFTNESAKTEALHQSHSGKHTSVTYEASLSAKDLTPSSLETRRFFLRGTGRIVFRKGLRAVAHSPWP
jgi:hypothetical protein